MLRALLIAFLAIIFLTAFFPLYLFFVSIIYRVYMLYILCFQKSFIHYWCEMFQVKTRKLCDLLKAKSDTNVAYMYTFASPVFTPCV